MNKQLFTSVFFFSFFGIALYVFSFLTQKVPQWVPGLITKMTNLLGSEALVKGLVATILLTPLMWAVNTFYTMGINSGVKGMLPFAFILLLALITQSVIFVFGDMVAGKTITTGTIVTAGGMILAGVIGYYIDMKISG